MADGPLPSNHIKEHALYIIDRIRPEIEQESFRAIVRYTEHLYHLVRCAAIIEERNEVGWPIIVPPFDPETEHRKLLNDLES